VSSATSQSQQIVSNNDNTKLQRHIKIQYV
jgi:hypothetical protein